MTHNDDFIAQLEDYFEAFDGATPLPDRVRDAIRAELPSARQVGPRTGLLRTFTMLSNTSNVARLGAAAAVVAVAVVLGATLMSNRGGGPGVQPGSASPIPTSFRTSAPTPSASLEPSMTPALLTLKTAPLAPCDATDTKPTTCVAPGTYQLNDWPGPSTWPVRVTITVPAGWFDWDAAAGIDAALVGSGAEARGGSGWGILFATVGDVSRDPCDRSKGVISAGQVDTPQKLAAVMAAWPRFTASLPSPITVDGHAGLELRLTSTAAATCSDTGVLWTSASGGKLDVYPMVDVAANRAPGTFEIVDTGHGLLVIRMTDFPHTSPAELGGGIPASATRHAADQTALHAILASIRFTDLAG